MKIKSIGVTCCLTAKKQKAQVLETSETLIKKARSGGGPFFLEAFTYRWYGHVDWREDGDVGIHRSSKDLSNWKKR